jgi:hypothetical protein
MHESVGPGRIVRREIRAANRNETATLAEARQRGFDMAQRCIGHPAIDLRERREWRVHQYYASLDFHGSESP